MKRNVRPITPGKATAGWIKNRMIRWARGEGRKPEEAVASMAER
jgi:hypothetical protein